MSAQDKVSALTTSLEVVKGKVAEFDKISAGLAAIEKEHPKDVVCDVTTREGMKQAVAGRAAWRDPRVALEKVRQAAKAPVLALGREIDGFAKALEATLLEGEENYDRQIKVETEKKKRDEEAKAKAEADRIVEAERLAKEVEAQKIALERAELERQRQELAKRASEQAQAERESRLAIELAERIARGKIEEQERVARQAREKEEAELKAVRDRLEEDRLAAEQDKRREREAEEQRLAEIRRAEEAAKRKIQEEEEARQRETRRKVAEVADLRTSLEIFRKRAAHLPEFANVIKAINELLEPA